MGRIAYARVFGGGMNEGAEFAGADGEMTRAGALFTVQGATTAKTARVRDGEIVGIGKAEGVQAGYLLGNCGRSRARRIVTEMPETNEIGRAPVLTPVTNAHLVSRLMLEKKKHNS